jgi:putative CocE/NonD family hydrolase
LLGAPLAQALPQDAMGKRYEKREVRIPMRDGVHLFTSIYVPRDASPQKQYPLLMTRTCYSVSPYGPKAYPHALGPSRELEEDGYIFVYQDVRGCFMSEGRFMNMTPHVAEKSGPQDVDESSDTYDTIEWLLANVEHHNGRVGQWGISYPGFYAAAGMIDAHPALKAVSPQAPIADWWYDDFHHHGAFFLTHGFNFLSGFGQPRPDPTPLRPRRFEHGTPDGYQFFLDMGPLNNANAYFLRDRVTFWNEIVAHPNYDEFWQARNLLPHLKNVAPAVLIVGGWFDAEDLYGALQTYRQIEQHNPHSHNSLVMGPWAHGGWSRARGNQLGKIEFESDTSAYFQRWIEYVFFHEHLKDGGPTLPEAYMFETGGNQWCQFDVWPPADSRPNTFYFSADGKLQAAAPTGPEPQYDEFPSDPRRPVPYTEEITIGMDPEYMIDDQRFASRRPDVLTYVTDPLPEDLVVAGPLQVDLRVSTTQTDADWIVKLVDVFPADGDDSPFADTSKSLAGYQMHVRSEVIRGRFRNHPAHPEPFVPNQVTQVKLPLQDVLHRFRAGHRLMIQVHSTWFPLVDRNPQKYVDNIYLAEASDFVTAAHRVYRSAEQPSRVELLVLPK